MTQLMRQATATAVTDDPILTRFRQDVDKALGNRVERVVLFGSRARGDFNAESDWDIAVFLRDMGTRWDEIGTLADITTRIPDLAALTPILTKGYEFKTDADYSVGPEAATSIGDAKAIIASAQLFIDTIRRKLASEQP